MNLHAAIDVLILVEDPGAANLVIALPKTLAEQGIRSVLFTAGTATDYLRNQGVSSEMLSDSADVEAVVDRYRPRLVVAGTAEDPDCFGLRLIRLATMRAIKSLGIVDAPSNAAHRFRGRTVDPLGNAPDIIAVAESTTAAAFSQLGYPHDRIVVCGHPHFDYVRDAGRELAKSDRAALRRALFPDLIIERPIVLFAAELSTGLDPAQYQRSSDYTLLGHGDDNGRTEIVLQEFLAAVAPWRQDVSLVLRLHPKNLADDLSQFRSAFDVVSQREPSLNVLYAIDKVVGMSSMLLSEAHLLGRPTLAILPRVSEAAWLLPIAAGLIPRAFTRAETVAGMKTLLREESARSDGFDALYPPGAVTRLCKLMADTLEQAAG